MLKIIKLSLLIFSLLTVLALDPLLRRGAPADIQAASLNPTVKAKAELIQATALYTLYDGSLGTTPDNQGFDYLALASAATQTITTGGTILDTMPDITDRAGYFNRSAQTPVLDRTSGYTVASLSRLSPRPTQTLIGLDSALSCLATTLNGIELGFWGNEIWAQEDGAAESTSPLHSRRGDHHYDHNLTPYQLRILSNTYTLYANSAPILTGSVRDYTAFGGFTLTPVSTSFSWAITPLPPDPELNWRQFRSIPLSLQLFICR